MKFFTKHCLKTLLLVLAVGMFSACSSDEKDTLKTAVENVDGLVQLDNATIEGWDEGYVSNNGYILAKGLNSSAAFSHALKAGALSRSGVEAPCISYMNTSRSLVAHLFFSEDGLPSQVVIGDNTLYFNFLSDTVLELVFSSASGYNLQATVEYDPADLQTKIQAGDYSFFFQTRLATVVELLRGATIPAEFASLVKAFEEIAGKTLAEDPDATIQDLIDNGLLDDNGQAAFIEDIVNSYDEVVVKVHYALMLWTGDATFKVGGTSCTIAGTIHCASESFNSLGRYGIVCDTDPAKLTIDQAEYVEYGYQDGISTHFDVDIRGLKALTTYYYRAFYAFNDADHGELQFKYGEPDAQVGYDTVTKEFTTEENRLYVDVVMCIDVTGSMSDIINTVKRNAMSFYDAFNDKCVNAGIQLDGLNNKVIAFQDKNVDGSLWWSESEFYALPAQLDEFNGFVSNLRALGGGDTPESGLEALDGAFSALESATDDGFHRQVIILWTDAPYLVGGSYTSLTTDILAEKWNKLSSGRRLILFAPNGDYGCYNGGGWEVFDDWKNVIHSTDISAGFSDFGYILDSIIEELTGRGEHYGVAAAPRSRAGLTPIVIRPN